MEVLILIFLTTILLSQSLTLQFTPSDDGTNHNSTVALILARGGSKGVKLKNLQKINGLSLLGRTILIIQNSHQFTEIWVSTDHYQIGLEAIKYGAKFHYRSSNYADDTTTSIQTVQEFLRKHQQINGIALFQCTSIFQNEIYIEKASYLFDITNTDCIFSVVRSFKLRWNWNENSQKLISENFNPFNRPRRQDWIGELIETGMFYYTRRQLLMNGTFQNNNCRYIEINGEDSLEIDTIMDLKMAEFLVKYRELN